MVIPKEEHPLGNKSKLFVYLPSNSFANMKYTKELKRAYDKIKGIPTEFSIEDFKTVRLVHDYRMAFKPKKVKTLLLAESHVYTTPSERNTRNKLKDILPNYPDGFVRFVYCLSYGESYTLESKLIDKNSGTPQFWKLFNTSISGKYKITNIGSKQRLVNKIRLLMDMMDKGVWLMDASIVGLYNKKLKPNYSDYENILKESFKNYVLPIINNENPKRIVVIGKAVYDTIKTIADLVDPGFSKRNIVWIHQPNARLKDQNKRRTL